MNQTEYKTRVAALGCVVCGRPAELHHPRFAVGMAQRESDWLVVPLCETHHRTGGHGTAIHAGKQSFEKNHGTEPVLLAWVIRIMVSN